MATAFIVKYDDGSTISQDRRCQRHVVTGTGPVPSLLHEEVVDYHAQFPIGELELGRPYSGKTHWNSLYWTNYPPLYIFGSTMDENPDADFYTALRTLNTDGKLSETWVLGEAAREDLCLHTKMPKGSKTLKVEVMSYEGQRDTNWKFPLAHYMPKRDNHRPYEAQARRCFDEYVIHMGINAMDYAAKVGPVEEIEAYIHQMDYSGNPTWGVFHDLMRINGWPYKISQIGCFEGHGPEGVRLHSSIHYTEDRSIFGLLQGRPEMKMGADGKMKLQAECNRKGWKFFALLMDLDWISPKLDESKVDCPEIPVQKGYVWFKVVDTCTVPSTGKKGIKIEILKEGIIPCWMDLKHLQVWAGGKPLGYLNEATSNGPPKSNVSVYRVLNNTIDADGKPGSSRRIVTENTYSKIVFKEPLESTDQTEFVDMGWAIRDCMYKGAMMTVGARPGKWIEEEKIGEDEGYVIEKAVRIPLLHKGKIIDD
mmetsp:Transcript_113703/g.213013  ORF Transcript_113703/g.213013 Transcript_113703/m.213013 type:complete len:480 (-) Transcript_113703:71-1510(-)